jgi:hypothetical protein
VQALFDFIPVDSVIDKFVISILLAEGVLTIVGSLRIRGFYFGRFLLGCHKPIFAEVQAGSVPVQTRLCNLQNCLFIAGLLLSCWLC